MHVSSVSILTGFYCTCYVSEKEWQSSVQKGHKFNSCLENLEYLCGFNLEFCLICRHPNVSATFDMAICRIGRWLLSSWLQVSSFYLKRKFDRVIVITLVSGLALPSYKTTSSTLATIDNCIVMLKICFGTSDTNKILIDHFSTVQYTLLITLKLCYIPASLMGQRCN